MIRLDSNYFDTLLESPGLHKIFNMLILAYSFRYSFNASMSLHFERASNAHVRLLWSQSLRKSSFSIAYRMRRAEHSLFESQCLLASGPHQIWASSIEFVISLLRVIVI